MPEGWAEVCRKADRLVVALPGFGPRLRGEWQSNGKLRAWWDEHPEAAVWIEALNELAGVEPDKRHVGFLIGIAKRLGRSARDKAARAATPPSRLGGEREYFRATPHPGRPKLRSANAVPSGSKPR